MTSDTPPSVPLEVLSLDPLSPETPLEDWQALCAAALSPNPFFGPDFLCPFLDNMDKGRVRLVVVREAPGGRWLVAAPVGRRRFGLAVPVNTTWATDYAPLGTPLIHPQAGDEAIAAFLDAARSPGNALAIPYLPLHSQSAIRLRAAGSGKSSVLSKSVRASHNGGATGKAQLAEADSGKRRKEMRRLMRRLGDHGKTTFRSLDGPEAVAGFEAFLALEASGWKGREGTALVSQPRTADFARTAIANLARRNAVRIDQLWSGETLVAALVLFLQSGKVFTWKIAFDEEFARYSPGAQLALQTLKTNLAIPGFRVADSLAIPGHSMIEPLWRGRLEIGTVLYADGLKRALCKADLKLEQTLLKAARTVRARLRS
ncbi:GNAT family N-acetyltransferase [Roseibium aggregatum]|uniref:GNAT family N-acetyltransferase n=1 Tax=Roseibium aggregatum TaxID=187304 RepID=UPI0012F4B706|nr:GNAT family N-acetyltransferase [Roseibium aggregatum]